MSDPAVSNDNLFPRRVTGFLRLLGPTLLALFLAVIFSLRVQPIGRMDSHYYRMLIAVAVMVLLCCVFQVWIWFPKAVRPWEEGQKPASKTAGRLLDTLLALVAVVATFNYYQFDKKVFVGVGDYADVTYYYLNSKYFDELSYFYLYPAMLLADSETENRLHFVDEYRDLHSYKRVPRSHAFKEQDIIHSRFTPQRWSQFKHDLDFLISKNISGGWSYFFIDHGYNPPPTWTFVGRLFSSVTPVEKLKHITIVDIFLVVIMFGFIGYAFGFKPLVLSVLFFLCTFSGRWPILGHALLRFDWLTSLVVGVCMLKLNKHGIAGALLMYSALNRVFPAIFFFPYGVAVVWHFFRFKRFETLHVRFIIGATIMFVVLIGGAIVFVGPSSFGDARRNLAMHGSSESYSSHRVGLGDALLYRGETTRSQMAQRGEIWGIADKLGEVMPLLYILGIVSLGGIAWYIVRVRPPLFDAIHFAVIPLFIVTNPQINYYNLRLLLILHHAVGFNRFRNRLGLLMLFGIEAVTQYVMTTGVERYAVTCTTSIGLAIYFAVQIIYYFSDLWSVQPVRSPR